MTAPKQQGGLGFKHVYFQGRALLAKWASHILIDVPSKWNHIFCANIDSFAWENPCLLHHHNYSLSNKMLSNKPKSCGYCQYTKGLWLAWASLKNLLFYFLLGAWIPTWWTIQHFLSNFRSLCNPHPNNIRLRQSLFAWAL